MYKEQYEKTIIFETGVALAMAQTMIIPAVVKYQNELALTVSNVKNTGLSSEHTEALLKKLSGLGDCAMEAVGKLEKAQAGHSVPQMLGARVELRAAVDALEAVVSRELWPLPTYAEMLFVM
ncbi:MAG: hypothetical protein ABII74_02980 [Elusimicrobiota bacterium]